MKLALAPRPLMIYCAFCYFTVYIIYTSRYVNRDEKGIESAAGNSGEDIK
jgi:hypothetical protein